MIPEPWILFLFLAMVLTVAGREWRLIQLRQSLNRALHEARRPLQVLALDSGDGDAAAGGNGVWQAVRALGDLDRQLNGGAAPPARKEMIACRLLVDSCVRRWQSRAHLAGAAIELRWVGADALVLGDGVSLAAAIENVLLNAIEHGGPEIKVSAVTVGRWVRIEVTDSGSAARSREHRDSPAAVIARQRGGSHGHGLEIVERAVRAHGGRLDLAINASGSSVTIALPCSRSGGRARGKLRVNW